MLLLPTRRPAAGVGAAMMLATMAAVVSVSDAPAAQPNRPVMAQRTAPYRPVMVQHTAPFQQPAPAFHPAPVQRVVPHVVTPPSAPPAHVMPPFTQPQNNNNFQAVNPSVQHVNPGLPLNNPSALRPNLPLNNPSALAPSLPPNNPSTLGPNLPPNNPGAPNFSPANPNFVHGGASAPQGPAIIKLGPSQPVVNSTLLKPAPGAFQQTKPGFPAVHLHDKFWPLHKDSRFMWVRGQRRLFVPVALLGVVVIGGSYWYPDGYVSMEGPACTGFTPDGCQLQWRVVDFEDGGGEPQCVQYCPQVGPPPEQVATLPPPPPTPAENGACQTTIYAEPNFAGNSAPTGDSQPSLSQSGWRNEISSIVVGAGTWDFFSDENFGGESMRLTPGTYATLSAEWTKRIGSFMCVQPGPPRA
jgi:Beta/Gamma crystallin